MQIRRDHDWREKIGSLADFELGTKNTDWKDISWKKLAARARKEQAAGHPRRIQLEVYAKPAAGNRWLMELYQEFGLDDRAAERYGEGLIREGLADSVSISAFYSRHGGYYSRTHGSWQTAPITLHLVTLERDE